MKVFKFGGASVRDADSIKNILNILNIQKTNLIIVVSAMGKMTNALELLCNSYFNKSEDTIKHFENIKEYHFTILESLFKGKDPEVFEKLECLFNDLLKIINSEPSLCYDYEYDRIISFGELFSSTIVSAFLNKQGQKVKFVDIRKCLKTDNVYRNANIDLELSAQLCKKVFTFQDTFTYITQGFISGTRTNQTTTLGREGSDYTAAILANFLEAEDVTIWKDVPGIMSADPKEYANTEIIPKLSYKEAIELSNFGAKVIHPKTIKPLQNKKIPLFVKSFINPENNGSVIRKLDEKLKLPPIYINKGNQLLLTITPRDFSFIAEEKLSHVFSVLAKYRLKFNLMQNSAIDFSMCVDRNDENFELFMQELKPNYGILYNGNVSLITIRHYNDEIIEKLTTGKKVLVEQRSRMMARFVVENAIE